MTLGRYAFSWLLRTSTCRYLRSGTRIIHVFGHNFRLGDSALWTEQESDWTITCISKWQIHAYIPCVNNLSYALCEAPCSLPPTSRSYPRHLDHQTSFIQYYRKVFTTSLSTCHLLFPYREWHEMNCHRPSPANSALVTLSLYSSSELSIIYYGSCTRDPDSS